MTPPANNLEAQVAVLEARTDGRISSMETTFANFILLMDERQKVADERHKASEARFDRIEAMLAEMRANIASLRITIIVTGISSVLAATFGIAALNANMQSNIFDALSFGKEMSALQTQITQQTDTNRKQAEATAALLKQLQHDFDQHGKDKPTSD